ncbi:hypothetical protein [Aeromonas rivipollensis]|uniref:hypothetical protein n=1 Tax=Aeromonas rivipollensis TaxID=948519 RepID=UPI00259E2FE8|nr:hypothetical protein [Aeromonas rivipollensis]MDM5122779.1 hypothetical protein [Aeromonas rivipollensis]
MISPTTRERWNTKTIMTITFLVSLFLIASSMFLPTKYGDWKNILISVACSILASNLIMYLSSEFMLRSKRRTDIIDKWGVEAIYKTRAEMNSSSNIALSKCKDEIEIIAFGLKGFRETQTEEIKRLISKRITIKILTLHPESKNLELVDEREGQVTGATKKSIQDLINWCEDLNEITNKPCVEIKFYDFLPLDFYFRIDDHVYVGPYLRGISSQQTISYEFTTGEGYKYWTNYFKTQWNS